MRVAFDFGRLGFVYVVESFSICWLVRVLGEALFLWVGAKAYFF